jgi:DNA-binding CsgD family transcriptional regulator
VRYIPAAATESWLEQQSMGWLGINRNDYTVFLINWYGRPDFQFHTYTNIGPADPDTRIVIGKIRDSSHIRAWGGQSGPTWFYDLSAGPVWAEHEILDLIAQGQPNASIATRLSITDKTVRNHISNIFAKLAVADRAQAVIRAREAGLGAQHGTSDPKS